MSLRVPRRKPTPPAKAPTHVRPQTRGDCLPGGCNEARPCPWVSCAYHLAFDVSEATGRLIDNRAGQHIWEMAHTCALDVADDGEIASNAELAAVINLTPRMVDKIVEQARRKLRDVLSDDSEDYL